MLSAVRLVFNVVVVESATTDDFEPVSRRCLLAKINNSKIAKATDPEIQILFLMVSVGF